MKRFLLFKGESYYACGGALDLQGHFDSVEEAKASLSPEEADTSDRSYDWWHIFDTVEMKLADYKKGCYCGTSYHMGQEAFEKMQNG